MTSARTSFVVSPAVDDGRPNYDPGRRPLGLSPEMPHPTTALPPVAYFVYQTPLLKRHTVKSLRPSPSQSPDTGMSLKVPHVVASTPPLDLEISHWPLLGLNTPASLLPSPSQSPATGMSPGAAPCNSTMYPPPVERHVPDASGRPEADDVQRSIAVEVGEQRIVAGHFPPIRSCRSASRRLISVPGAGVLSKDDQIVLAVAIDVAGERNVEENAPRDDVNGGVAG